jgi:hypothetical protein
MWFTESRLSYLNQQEDIAAAWIAEVYDLCIFGSMLSADSKLEAYKLDLHLRLEYSTQTAMDVYAASNSRVADYE